MEIHYQVDIQNDFMNPNGALYVPKAEELKTAIGNLSKCARTNKIPIWCSIDIHYGDEKHKEFEGELQKWGGPFPDHCMAGTIGAERIVEVYRMENKTFSKHTYDIFADPNKFLEKALIENGVKKAIIYGVATDYCILAAVMGMQKLGIQCYVVTDAIKGIDDLGTQQAFDQMKEAGAKFIGTMDYLERM